MDSELKKIILTSNFFPDRNIYIDIKENSLEDEYGTSILSIQFLKAGTNTLSIKNRYNHTVSNPDVTFSNNLDNIIFGLTESFEKHLWIQY